MYETVYLFYSGKETQLTLCVNKAKLRSSVEDLRHNKHQLLHRITSVMTPLICNIIKPISLWFVNWFSASRVTKSLTPWRRLATLKADLQPIISNKKRKSPKSGDELEWQILARTSEMFIRMSGSRLRDALVLFHNYVCNWLINTFTNWKGCVSKKSNP